MSNQESLPTSDAAPSMPVRSENEFIGYALRPDGRKEIRWQSGKEVEVDLPDEILQGIPVGLRKKHVDFLFALEDAAEVAKARKRAVSLLQEELLKIGGVTKHLIKECERWGFIECRMVTLAGAGKNHGGHKAVVLTPQGKALLKHMSDAMAEVAQAESISTDTQQ